jgi:2-dehydrotetronate isomerase
MVQFAANLSMMFNEWDFLDRFSAAKDAGFDAVEFLFPYAYPAETILKKVEDNNLTIALFNFFPGQWDEGERGLASLPGREDEFLASIDQALRYADVLGVKRLHVMSGLEQRSNPGAANVYKSSLIKACEAAEKKNITILIEPINSRDMPNYFLNDFNFAVDLIRQLGIDNLRLQYDIYHRQIVHGDVIKSLEAFMQWIGHIQIASVPLRHEPTTGELNDKLILNVLDQLNYQGYVGLEYRPQAGTLQGLNWLEHL